tara:strand:- start:218 stop:484 length:267 start_codon:yes stop_codon:yes gene_type:complete
MEHEKAETILTWSQRLFFIMSVGSFIFLEWWLGLLLFYMSYNFYRLIGVMWKIEALKLKAVDDEAQEMFSSWNRKNRRSFLKKFKSIK